MGINVDKGTTIFDLGSKMKFYLNAMCENKRFPTIVARAAFGGLSMIAAGLIMTAVSGGTASPLALAAVGIGCVLLGGAVIAGLLFGVNKLIDHLAPKADPENTPVAYPGF